MERKMNKKDRRHSGRVYPQLNGFPIKELFEQGLEHQEFYDDWSNYKDGFRYNGDRSQIRNPNMMTWKEGEDLKRQNQKLLKHAKIRKVRREKKLLKEA